MSQRRTTEVESDVKYAKGNADSPEKESQFHQAMRRPHALSIRTMGSDLSADNTGNRSNPHTATDDRNEDDGDDTVAETQPDGHRVSQLSADMYDSEGPPTPTPFTTMDNSQTLEGAAPRGRSGEIKAELDRLGSIIQTPSNTVKSDDGAGRPETPQRERSPARTPPRPVSAIPVVPLKDDALSPVLLQLTTTDEPPASASTMRPADTTAPTAHEPSEKRGVFRSVRNLTITTVSISGTKKVYRRVKIFFKEEVVTKLRSR